MLTNWRPGSLDRNTLSCITESIKAELIPYLAKMDDDTQATEVLSSLGEIGPEQVEAFDAIPEEHNRFKYLVLKADQILKDCRGLIREAIHE